MQRRSFNQAGVSALGLLIVATHRQALALSLSDLSRADALKGLQTTLEKGALAAIALLGKPGGFLGNPKVRIPLPGYFEDVSNVLRSFGQSARLDELVSVINRAAETAVPLSQDLLVSAVRAMNANDAKNVLTGGVTSITDFLSAQTRAALDLKFLPVVTQATQKIGLIDTYNGLAGKAADFGFVKKENASLQQYVTGKTLDGLYRIIGEEEKKIRQDPLGTASAMEKKAFGAPK